MIRTLPFRLVIAFMAGLAQEALWLAATISSHSAEQQL